MTARLNQINIVVADMEAMTEFYRRLGLDIEAPMAGWAADHRSDVGDGSEAIDFDLDSLAFARVWNEGSSGRPGIVLGFQVASRSEVDRLHRELTAAGYRSQQAPYDAFWGARYAVVADPDGNPVGLMSASNPDRAAPPPPPPTNAGRPPVGS